MQNLQTFFSHIADNFPIYTDSFHVFQTILLKAHNCSNLMHLGGICILAFQGFCEPNLGPPDFKPLPIVQGV